MLKFNKYYQDAKVMYVGSRWAKEIGSKMGWVIGQIKNEPGKYVVEFGDESYVMPEGVLAPFVATAAKESGPEIRQIRKRSAEEEV